MDTSLLYLKHSHTPANLQGTSFKLIYMCGEEFKG